MATTDRTDPDDADTGAPAGALAGRLREATFAHLLVRADGESLAAAGLLAAACASIDTPYQVSPVRTRDDVHARATAADGDATDVGIGVPGAGGIVDRPAVSAFEAAEHLDVAPDPVVALAGVVACGRPPEDAAPALLERSGVQRCPGLAVPTDDPADGLAYSTLAHAPYSGDLEAAEAVAETAAGDADGGDAAERRLASLLAVDCATADGASVRAATAVERAIHPLAGGPMRTIDGFADVLGALAAAAPGLGVCLSMGNDDGSIVDGALDAWRAHAGAAHDGVQSARTDRLDGVLVAHVDGPVCAIARLLRDYRTPDPAVLAIGDGEAALATVDGPAEPIEAAAAAAGGSGLARGSTGYARFEPDLAADFVETVTEAL